MGLGRRTGQSRQFSSFLLIVSTTQRRVHDAPFLATAPSFFPSTKAS
jgi:hypothetical protein